MYIVSITAYVALFLVTAYTFFLCMRYNIHMFQQNGYKNREHCDWIKKYFYRQRFLLILVPAVVILALARTKWSAVFSALFVLPVMWGYKALKGINTKKKLVYTNRVKRLMTANVVLAGLVCCVVSFVGTGMAGRATCILLSAVVMVAVEPYAVILCNIIMKPVEKAVNDSFINDAKHILERNKDLIVIGVTGSYGKTSLKFFLQALLSEKYNVLATPESFNTPMGVVRTIRESLKPTHDIFICEMGARHVGDIKEICDIVHPDHGVITSVGPQHLETFFTIDNVRNTKFELAGALSKDGRLFLNGDSDEIMKDNGAYNKIYYSLHGKNGYNAKDITVTPRGTDFTVVSPDGTECGFHMQLLGELNVLNVLGAIAVANSFGIKLEDLKIPVRRLMPVSHRLELIDRGAYTLIDDAYNSNPVGSKAAVETLGSFPGIRILITPGMVELGERDAELHYAFGTYAAKSCDYILLVNKNRTKDIKKGALESGFPKEKLFDFDKFTEAMDFALTNIKESERKVILIENDLPDNY